MNQRLTENERGLLSAYLDGELTGVEREQAERLLAGSAQARAYLSELKALDRLSSQVLGLSLPAGTVAAASRITASSIKAAAGVSGVKTGIIGSWGGFALGGLVTAAVVTVGVIVWPGADDDMSSLRSSRSDVPSVPVRPALNLDSSSVIVPEMTPVELVAFAVDGTLPIDVARRKFITIASRSADSLAVALHSTAPKNDLVRELARLGPSAIPSYDSLIRISRLAVLRSNDGAIAVSPSVPELRRRILESLARVDPADVSPSMRARFEAAGERLAVVRSRREQIEEEHVSFEDLCEAIDGKRDAPYVLIGLPNGGLLRTRDIEAIEDSRPVIVSIDFEDGPAVRIEPRAYRVIGRYAFARAPSPESTPAVDGPGAGAIPAIDVSGAQRARALRADRQAGGGVWVRERAIPPVPLQAPLPNDNERTTTAIPPSQPASADEINRRIQERLQRANERIRQIEITIQRRDRSGDNGAEEGSNGGQGGAGGDE